MEYKVMIDAFEGPLDLLLHLVKKANIDIKEINILEIARQYLDYINSMEKLSLDIASEYLIMAAELIEMKSNILLPKTDTVLVEEERQELINKLLDYEQYKNITFLFKDLEMNRRDEFTKKPEDLKKYGCVSEVYLSRNIGLDDLVNAFNLFLKKKEFSKPLNTKIATREYSVTQRSNEILNIIKSRKKMDFNDLFDFYNKEYFVVTFLAILDLVRKSRILVNQDCNFNRIFIEEVTNYKKSRIF